MSSITSCCEFGDYQEDNACSEYTGGNDAVILVKKGVTIADYTDEDEVQAVIDAGNAKLLGGLKISINRPEAVRVDNPRACTPQAVVTYNHSATVMDGKATATNLEFYNDVDAATGCIFGSAIIHSCANSEQLTITGANILLIGGGGLQSPLSDEEIQDIELTLEWKSKVGPAKEAANPIFN